MDSRCCAGRERSAPIALAVTSNEGTRPSRPHQPFGRMGKGFPLLGRSKTVVFDLPLLRRNMSLCPHFLQGAIGRRVGCSFHLGLRRGGAGASPKKSGAVSGPAVIELIYWHDSHSSPLRMASMEQAFFSSSVKARFSWSARRAGRTSFLTATVAFSMLEAPRVRR